MGAEGMLPDPDDVIVTTGGQQAIDLDLQDPGRPRRRRRLRGADLPRRGAGLLQLPGRVDPDRVRRGRDADRELEDGLARARRRRAAAQIRLLGAQLPEPRRGDDVARAPARLVELARQRELLVVEDNPYGLLRFGGEPLPPLYQLDGGDFVIYIGTFSKILSPASGSAGPWRRRR
jgi:2-aminoadipate transaminase